MNDNIIYTNNDETIGFYNDLYKFYKDLIMEKLNEKDLEDASMYIEQLNEINDFSEYDGLLILSENNGMGFTCKKYNN